MTPVGWAFLGVLALVLGCLFVPMLISEAYYFIRYRDPQKRLRAQLEAMRGVPAKYQPKCQCRQEGDGCWF